MREAFRPGIQPLVPSRRSHQLFLQQFQIPGILHIEAGLEGDVIDLHHEPFFPEQEIGPTQNAGAAIVNEDEAIVFANCVEQFLEGLSGKGR